MAPRKPNFERKVHCQQDFSMPDLLPEIIEQFERFSIVYGVPINEIYLSDDGSYGDYWILEANREPTI